MGEVLLCAITKSVILSLFYILVILCHNAVKKTERVQFHADCLNTAENRRSQQIPTDQHNLRFK